MGELCTSDSHALSPHLDPLSRACQINKTVLICKTLSFFFYRHLGHTDWLLSPLHNFPSYTTSPLNMDDAPGWGGYRVGGDTDYPEKSGISMVFFLFVCFQLFSGLHLTLNRMSELISAAAPLVTRWLIKTSTTLTRPSLLPKPSGAASRGWLSITLGKRLQWLLPKQPRERWGGKENTI